MGSQASWSDTGPFPLEAPPIPFHSHPSPGAGVGLAQGNTMERGNLSSPTHDPQLHFGPKSGAGKAGPVGTGL